MFFGQVDREFVKHFASVTAESTKETAVTVHDDKAKLVIVFKQRVERLRVELVVAEIQ